MNKLNIDGLVNLEQPFIKVPFEQFKKSCKSSQKSVEKELGQFATTLEDLIKEENQEKVLQTLETFKTRLQGLKRKLSESKKEEEKYGQRTKLRLEHLNELSLIQTIDSEEFDRWSRIRLNRMLIEYLQRQSYFESAERMATEFHLKEFVDLELFQESKRIEDSIHAHSCQEALNWCKENSSSLKKIQSTFEFNLRFQEFVELIRVGKLKDAIQYTKKYLTLWKDSHMKEIQQGMALLAFAPTTKCGIYKTLFSNQRWNKLVEEFKKNLYELHHLPSSSQLLQTLQVGLTALKTPACFQDENKNVNCPVCIRDTFGKMAEKVPQSHIVNSWIVCRITGQLMNEHNPPMVLPNGNVYSTKALTEMSHRNGGMVEDPRTKTSFLLSQCRKAFIL